MLVFVLKNKAFLCSLFSHQNHHGVFAIFLDNILIISDTDTQSAKLRSSISESEEIILSIKPNCIGDNACF